MENFNRNSRNLCIRNYSAFIVKDIFFSSVLYAEMPSRFLRLFSRGLMTTIFRFGSGSPCVRKINKHSTQQFPSRRCPLDINFSGKGWMQVHSIIRRVKKNSMVVQFYVVTSRRLWCPFGSILYCKNYWADMTSPDAQITQI